MIQRLGIALRTPLRIHAIRMAMRAAWWLARPSILGVKVGEHYDLIACFETSAKGSSKPVERGTLLVNCHEVMHIRSQQTIAIDNLEEEMQC